MDSLSTIESLAPTVTPASMAQAESLPANSASAPVLDVRHLGAAYGKRSILRDVSFTLNADDFVAVIGPSGAGKSTLIRCINRLVEPNAGEVRFLGDDLRQSRPRALRAARRRIGMIFQEFNLVDRLSVLDNVLTGRLGYTSTVRSLARLYARADIERALVLLERVGLSEHCHKRADRLSGGQRQRVGIARALIQEPRLLLIDEPTSSLDPKIAREVMGLIRQMAEEFQVPVLCNIHDVDLATRFCSRIIGLQDGVKRFEGRPDELSPAALRDIYAMEVL